MKLADVYAAVRQRGSAPHAWDYVHGLRKHAPAERNKIFEELHCLLSKRPVWLPAEAVDTAIDLLFAPDAPDDEALFRRFLCPWLEGVAGRFPDEFARLIEPWPESIPVTDARVRLLAERGRLSGRQLCDIARLDKSGAASLSTVLANLPPDPSADEFAEGLAWSFVGRTRLEQSDFELFELWCVSEQRLKLAEIAPGWPSNFRRFKFGSTIVPPKKAVAKFELCDALDPRATFRQRFGHARERRALPGVRGLWMALRDTVGNRWSVSASFRGWLDSLLAEPVLAKLWRQFGWPVKSYNESSPQSMSEQERVAALLLLIANPPPPDGSGLRSLAEAMRAVGIESELVSPRIERELLHAIADMGSAKDGATVLRTRELIVLFLLACLDAPQPRVNSPAALDRRRSLQQRIALFRDSGILSTRLEAALRQMGERK